MKSSIIDVPRRYEATIELSAVTNLKAFDTPKKMQPRASYNYGFDGKEFKRRSELVLAVVRHYVEKHSGITLNELREAFNIRFNKNNPTIVISYDEAMTITDSAGKLGGDFSVKDDQQIVLTNNEVAVVWKYWPQRFFEVFIGLAKRLGYDITGI